MRKNNQILVLACALAVTALASGCSWRHQQSELSAAQESIDNRITSQVKANLASSPVYKYEDVNVQTFDGIVQLSGFVNTQEQKQRAGALAQNVMGVKRVENALTLKPEGDQRSLAPTGWTQGQTKNPTYPNQQNQPNQQPTQPKQDNPNQQ